MEYIDYPIPEQHYQIAAYGYEKAVRPNRKDLREGSKLACAGPEGCAPSEVAENSLAAAVAIKAMKMAKLKPDQIIHWLAESARGRESIRTFAKTELGMAEGAT